MIAGSYKSDPAEVFAAAQNGEDAALNELVQKNIPLVKYIVRRFMGRGKEYDDLFQTGCIGLIKAIRKFDCSMNVRFSTYAVPLIMGEIRRFLRDDNSVHISRSLHDLSSKINQYRQEYEKENGEVPGLNQICEALGAEREQALLALNASQPVRSLTEPVGSNAELLLGDVIPSGEAEAMEEKIILKDMLARLDPNEQLLINMRFFERRTQKDVGERLGMTQVQVSRMESRIFRTLRGNMGEPTTKHATKNQSRQSYPQLSDHIPK